MLETTTILQHMSSAIGFFFVVVVGGLIYYCLTSSDTDIPSPGLWAPSPGESDLSNKIQYKEWTATHMHPQL